MTSIYRALLVLWALGLTEANAQAGDAGTMMIWAAKDYNGWDNPLHSEVAINGTTINIFTDDAMEPIAEHLKEGWNKITVETTAQEPANQGNDLIFRIGPTHKEKDKVVMQPVLWQFRNGTDWKFKDGTYSHPLGPGVKKVMLEYSVYYAGMANEQGELKAATSCCRASRITTAGTPRSSRRSSSTVRRSTASCWPNGRSSSRRCSSPGRMRSRSSPAA